MEDHRGERFVEADFTDARFRSVLFSNVKISDGWLQNVDISGMIDRVTVNGIDVTHFVERSLDERHPERKLLSSTNPDGMRSAWNAIQARFAATLERARRLPEAQLDVSVDEEWSYLETLRHLVYATDRWLTGPVFRDPRPFHPLGMPNPPLDEIPAGVFDLEASPTLDDVLDARRSRSSHVAAYLAEVTMNDLVRMVPSPNGGMVPVRACLQVVLREEWWHDQYANRDLAVLEAGQRTDTAPP